MKITSPQFKRNAHDAMQDEQLQGALNHVRNNFTQKRADARSALKEFDDLLREGDDIEDYSKQFSDGSLHILNSNFRTSAIVKFKDLFPTYLTSLEFEATETDIQYFTAEVTF